MSEHDPLLKIEDLSIQYETDRGSLSAVSDASLHLNAGEYGGLVGESGCGKSTIAKSVMRGLDDNASVPSGSIRYKGMDILSMTRSEFNEKIAWTEISFIPQSAMNSLDPLRRVDTQAVELAREHTDMTKGSARDRLSELFDIVGLQKSRISDYPHEFSGGMQQRAIIAFALLLDPDLIIADEPTTALDVIMQDQVFSYLDDIREEVDTSMLLITHDISVVLETCNKITVMHAGQIAESGSAVDLYENPRHPYLILLQEAFPDIRHPKEELTQIEGKPGEQMGEVDHCTFADRCPWAVDECVESAPELKAMTDADDHVVGCIRRDDDLYADFRNRDSARTEIHND